jgi:uncharacterized protein (DUF433 family)
MIAGHCGWQVKDRWSILSAKETMMPIALDWEKCPALEQVPGKVSGAWLFRDTRVPVWAVLNALHDVPASEVYEDFPSIRPGDVEMLLTFLAANASAEGHDAVAA